MSVHEWLAGPFNSFNGHFVIIPGVTWKTTMGPFEYYLNLEVHSHSKFHVNAFLFNEHPSIDQLPLISNVDYLSGATSIRENSLKSVESEIAH